MTSSSFFSSLTFSAAAAEPRRAGVLRSTIFPISALDLDASLCGSAAIDCVSFFALTALAAAACLPPAMTSMLPLMALAASTPPSVSQLTPILASAARTSSSPTRGPEDRGTNPLTCCSSRGNSTGCASAPSISVGSMPSSPYDSWTIPPVLLRTVPSYLNDRSSSAFMSLRDMYPVSAVFTAVSTKPSRPAMV